MSMLPDNSGFSYIHSNIIETETILLNSDTHKVYTVALDPNSGWSNNKNKTINLNNVQDLYYLLYVALINNTDDLKKVEEYKTLLKINQNDYKITVLQIETGKEAKDE